MAPPPAVLPESFSGEKAKVVYAATITLDIPAGRDFKHEVEIPVARASGDRTMSPEPVTIRYPENFIRNFFRALRLPKFVIFVKKLHRLPGFLFFTKFKIFENLENFQ